MGRGVNRFLLDRTMDDPSLTRFSDLVLMLDPNLV